MTQEEAEALVAGQKMQYWDGRFATVVNPAYDYTPPLPTDKPCKRVDINFDADPDPKPIYRIKSFDFIRAAVIP